MTTLHFDIIIVGSGIVGLTTACALSKNANLNIALIDAKKIDCNWNKETYDHRVNAISPASKMIFQKLNVWEKIVEKRFSFYTDMTVWNQEGSGRLDFSCFEVGESHLGFIIEENVIRMSLYETLQNQIKIFSSTRLTDLYERYDGIELLTDDGNHFSTKLLIAADGANSWVRETCGIKMTSRDYHHKALIATVQTSLPHQNRAQQRFLSDGILAFLPLEDPYFSSIVWSTPASYNDELMNLPDEAFLKKITEAFEYKLGEVIKVSARQHFPLRMQHVKNYVKSRIALLGDAAHTIHPLAGQGVNLGLLDAITLAGVILTALQKKRDYSSFLTLRRYERERKSDNLAMLAIVDSLKFFFTHDKVPKALRSFGLNLTNQASVAKKLLIHYALGKRKNLTC